MKQISSETEIIFSLMDVRGKTALDVGCGTGALVKQLAARGARAIGLDSKNMLAKAEKTSDDKRCIACTGEKLAIRSNTFDLVLFIASLHHFPRETVFEALKEAKRVLTGNGRIVVLEPVGKPGSYFELIRLVEDERKLHKNALQAIRKAGKIGLKEIFEETCYMARTFNDYRKLLDIFVEHQDERNRCLEKAREITNQMSKEAEQPFDSFTFKSICRVNVLCA